MHDMKTTWYMYMHMHVIHVAIAHAVCHKMKVASPDQSVSFGVWNDQMSWRMTFDTVGTDRHTAFLQCVFSGESSSSLV